MIHVIFLTYCRTSSKIGNNFPTWAPKVERVPLKEINSVCLSASRVSERSASKYVGASSTVSNFGDRLFDSSTTSESKGCFRDEGISTPVIAQVQRSEFFSINQCSPVSCSLDDDFDSSIFEAIDLLCDGTHGSSVKKIERGVDTNQDHIPNNEADDGNDSNARSVSHTKLEIPQGVQGDVSQHLIRKENITHAKEFSGMPESYSKYLESLNEDQLDAASTDASTPLMVVAGPGSGKVCRNLLLFTFLNFSFLIRCSFL